MEGNPEVESFKNSAVRLLYYSIEGEVELEGNQLRVFFALESRER
jgi:hypothetical protein